VKNKNKRIEVLDSEYWKMKRLVNVIDGKKFVMF